MYIEKTVQLKISLIFISNLHFTKMYVANADSLNHITLRAKCLINHIANIFPNFKICRTQKKHQINQLFGIDLLGSARCTP